MSGNDETGYRCETCDMTVTIEPDGMATVSMPGPQLSPLQQQKWNEIAEQNTQALEALKRGDNVEVNAIHMDSWDAEEFIERTMIGDTNAEQ